MRGKGILVFLKGCAIHVDAPAFTAGIFASGPGTAKAGKTPRLAHLWGIRHPLKSNIPQVTRGGKSADEIAPDTGLREPAVQNFNRRLALAKQSEKIAGLVGEWVADMVEKGSGTDLCSASTGSERFVLARDQIASSPHASNGLQFGLAGFLVTVLVTVTGFVMPWRTSKLLF